MHNHVHPKFSIITVTYNAGAVLEDTIQSVITQTYRNVEYIIVDGGSKDHTLLPRAHPYPGQRTGQRPV